MKNIYLDTCVLPQRGRLRSGLLLSLPALARLNDYTIMLPELVVEEYRQVRLRSAADAAERLLAAHRKAHDHLFMDELYIPSPDEVVDPLITDLTSLCEIIEVRDEDARSALLREAKRIAPARDGRGARDAGIWLSIVRHHRDTQDEGILITTNTKDYCDNVTQAPHSQLLEDLAESEGRFEFVFKPFEFLRSVAPSIAVDSELVLGLDRDAELLSDIAHAFTASGPAGIQEGSEDAVPYWELHSDRLKIVWSALSAYEVAENVLVRVKLQITAPISETEVLDGIACIAWINAKDGTFSLIDVEHLHDTPSL